MQVADAKFVAHWKHQYWAPLSWRSMEFSAFLAFAVWTSSMTYLTFGKGELQNAHHLLSLCSYFSPCYIIFRHSLFLFRWFTTADALSLLTCRYDQIKNLNTINMVFKGRNLSLVNFFWKDINSIYKGVLLWWTISEVFSCYKKIKNCYDEELLHSKQLQS